MLLDLHTDFSGCRSGGLVFQLFNNFPQSVVIHIVKGFGVVNKARVDVFLELSSVFNDPMDVGNLTSGSPTFSKSRISESSLIHYSTSYKLVHMSIENHLVISIKN